MSTPMTPERLDEIATRAAHQYEYATSHGAECDTLAGEDVPALLAEVERLRRPTFYRAWHFESDDTLGHYLTRDEARKHCASKVEQEERWRYIESADWVPCCDEPHDQAAEELVIVASGEVFETGYTVTPIVPAVRYDEDAAEGETGGAS